jgi:hypothetical protein
MYHVSRPQPHPLTIIMHASLIFAASVNGNYQGFGAELHIPSYRSVGRLWKRQESVAGTKKT